MRRSLPAGIAFLAFSASFVAPPLHAAPSPAPVETSTESIPVGSVAVPASGVLVGESTGTQTAGSPAASPTLSVTRADVEEFSLVGVTWANDPAVTDTVVRLRVESAGSTWGQWTEAETLDLGQDAGTPAATTRGGTEGVWTGPSTGIDVEVTTHAGANPVDVRVDLVDPGTGAADADPGPAVQPSDAAAPEITPAAAAAPPIFTRAQWGADERLRTWNPRYAPALRAATLHHTVGTNAYEPAAVPGMLRAIYRYHAVSRGWGDIGYNVLVDRFGRLWEGRYGGLARPVIGAHAAGFNTGTTGVSLMGNFETEDVPPAMLDAVDAFIAWKFALSGIDPGGSTTLVSGGGTSRFAVGAQASLPTIFGHRDVGRTLCPGQYAYDKLPAIRAAVAEIMKPV